MCIIVFKPKNHAMPTLKTMEQCFKTNPHGAGFMYRHGGKIHIVKGFMTLESLLNALNLVNESVNLKKTDLCIHFRISTTGSVKPENCHPFPLSNNPEDLKALSIITDRALAHNGILYEYSKFHNADTDMSDTMYFTKMLSGVKDRFIPLLIEPHTRGNNRFVIMTAKKTISWGMIQDGGLFYSNGAYRTYDDEPEFEEERSDYDSASQTTLNDKFRAYMQAQKS